MTTGAADDHTAVDMLGQIQDKSSTSWDRTLVRGPSSRPGPAPGRWEVQIHTGEHRITRVACYGTTSQSGTQEPEQPEEVIWPTWPATIEDETEVATSPLADLQHYWSAAGDRLRESAKWMATVIGAALAAVVGSSPSANLSSHHLQVVAAAIGLVGLSCLAVTMVLVLRVLQPPEVSFEQIEAAGEPVDTRQSSDRHGQHNSLFKRGENNALCRWKQKIESHQDLYLPCGVTSLGELRLSIRLEEATLVQLSWCGVDAADPSAAERLRSAQEARAARLLELRTAAARITAVGEYYAIQARSSLARYYGTAFGFLGTALIVLAFAWPLKR
jgi:hypothetical protein